MRSPAFTIRGLKDNSGSTRKVGKHNTLTLPHSSFLRPDVRNKLLHSMVIKQSQNSIHFCVVLYTIIPYENTC